jgi:putative flippase GtrA
VTRAGTARQFVRFAGVGVCGTAVHYLAVVLLVQGRGLGAVAASAAGFTAGALVNYVLNASLVFPRTRSHRDAVWRFMTVAAVGLALNSGVMAVATIALGFHYAVAQASATVAVLLWTFTGNRSWTFAEER